MIVSFKTYTKNEKNDHIYVDTITGILTKVFMNEEFLPDTSDINFKKLYITVGNTDYNFDLIHEELIIQVICSTSNITYKITKKDGNIFLDGIPTSLEKIYELISNILFTKYDI